MQACEWTASLSSIRSFSRRLAMAFCQVVTGQSTEEMEEKERKFLSGRSRSLSKGITLNVKEGKVSFKKKQETWMSKMTEMCKVDIS